MLESLPADVNAEGKVPAASSSGADDTSLEPIYTNSSAVNS